MPVKRDDQGRRYVEAEAEVPGTPEEVWRAIATGPGVSSWFVPTRIEERAGGSSVSSFGPGMDAVATITEWDPPHRFAAESDDLGPGAQPVATEWIVEARDGGTCVVRVVHRWFASSDDWDDQFVGHTFGWQAFFRVLRLYLAHFRGQPGTPVQLSATAPEPVEAAWARLIGGLGLAGAAEGRLVETRAAAPRLAGVVERLGPPEHPELLLRLDEPAPGLAHLVPHPMGGQVHVSVRLYLYGQDAPAVAAREEPRWQAWLLERFPPAAASTGAAAG